MNMADYIQGCKNKCIFDNYPMDDEERKILDSWHNWGEKVRRQVNKDNGMSDGLRAFFLSMTDLNDPRKTKSKCKGAFPFSREFTLFYTPKGAKVVKTWDARDGKRHTLVALETGEVSEPSSGEPSAVKSSIITLFRLLSRW
jgi:hypothetical protein